MENIQSLIDKLTKEIEKLKEKQQKINEEIKVLGAKKCDGQVLIDKMELELKEEEEKQDKHIQKRLFALLWIISSLYTLIVLFTAAMCVVGSVYFTNKLIPFGLTTERLALAISTFLISTGSICFAETKILQNSASFFENKIYNSDKNQHMLSVIDKLKEDLELTKEELSVLELLLNNKKTEYETCENQIVLLNNMINYILEDQNISKTTKPLLESSKAEEETKGIQRTRNL